MKNTHKTRFISHENSHYPQSHYHQNIKHRRIQGSILEQLNELEVESIMLQQLNIQNIKSDMLNKQLKISTQANQRAVIKLVQQQNLLIFNLKVQIKELQNFKHECRRLEILIKQIEEKYIFLEGSKSKDLQLNSYELQKLQLEYKQLHLQLNELSIESAKKYELILYLQQRHAYLRAQLNEIIEKYVQTINSHSITHQINEQRKTQNLIIKKQIELLDEENIKRIKLIKEKQEQQRDNRKKYQKLLEQVQNLQKQRERLKNVLVAAQNDNNLLKQQKQQGIKIRQEKNTIQLNLQQKRQHCRTEKAQREIDLQNGIKLAQSHKYYYQQQKIANQSLLNKLKQTVFHQQNTQHELSNISFIIESKNHLKNEHLLEVKAKRQSFQKDIYFIDQYTLVNEQLLKEIQLLVTQQMYKLQNSRYLNPSRVDKINSTMEFILHIKQQIYNDYEKGNELKMNLVEYMQIE